VRERERERERNRAREKEIGFWKGEVDISLPQVTLRPFIHSFIYLEPAESQLNAGALFLLFCVPPCSVLLPNHTLSLASLRLSTKFPSLPGVAHKVLDNGTSGSIFTSFLNRFP
jgi:hypothetical protein